MEFAEVFILLLYLPSFFIVETHMDAILCVCPMIHWVIHHGCVFDLTLDPHLEEMRATKVVHVLTASLYMV